MTPLWLETHAPYISSNRDTTADQITFNAGSLLHAALLKVPSLAAGVLKDGTPLNVEITVANDVSIGQTPGSETSHMACRTETTSEAKSGEVLSTVDSFDKYMPLPSASSYPNQFVFTSSWISHGVRISL